jgi:MFS family permease
VLAWIVLWWSAFTSLTGLAAGYVPLLVTRFFFGMGEAGALPNASAAVARWFPIPERGRAFGVSLMSSQLGGAIAPLLAVPIQARYGWRAAFYLFGILGVAWSVVWYGWFRGRLGAARYGPSLPREACPSVRHLGRRRNIPPGAIAFDC